MSVIYPRCVSTTIACEAIVNQNGMEFKDYADEAFFYGRCDDSGTYPELTDPNDVIHDIEELYHESKGHSEKEPDYAECRIVYKDDKESYDVKIALKEFQKSENETIDDKIFYYCNSLNDLKSLARHSTEDFILMECYRFDKWTEE